MYPTAPSPDPSARRALLVGVAREPQQILEVEEHLDELAALAESTGVRVGGRTLQVRRVLEPGTLIGRGKAAELVALADEAGADLILFDEDLSGGQVKNLEEIVGRQVMDRSGLILELFHQRARSGEARTQVELARLNYLLPRLTRRWRHLSRQTGGIGVRGGEGETQLEADRRVLRRAISRLSRDLKQIERTRALHRRGRRGTATVALAGYTNAGKSTLFNRLTHAQVLAEDRLFATLDSRLRRGSLGPQAPVVLFADTVGFIRKLPHHLVASFRSTLEEVSEADLVLHVVDASHPAWHEQRDVAAAVLRELGVADDRLVMVYNKVDRLATPPLAAPGELWISATSGAGVDELKAEVRRRLGRERTPGTAPDSEAEAPLEVGS
ncbi:MAG: GTPase HflX [Holophagales bacterium]|nr:MAG: GTPase HflX [Holophagales bacterium]